MPSATPLCDVADVEAALREDLHTDTNDATETAQAIRRASAAVRAFTRQEIYPHVDNDVVELAGTWERVLVLPQRPVTAIASIVVDGVTATGYTHTRRGRVRHPALIGRFFQQPGYGTPSVVPSFGYWGGSDAVLIVTYSHGYAAIPEDVREVTASAAARFLRNPLGKMAQDYEGTHVTGPSLMPLELSRAEKAMLNDYRRNG